MRGQGTYTKSVVPLIWAASLLGFGPTHLAAQSGPIRLVNGIPDGSVLIHGDILVPEETYLRGYYCPTPWPDGLVYFAFDSNVSYTNRRSALEAMDEWIGSAADVMFLPRHNQDAYLLIRDSSGDDEPANNSFIGMIDTQPQIVNIVDWNERFVIAHELGHALGFWHEQTRPNREDYVVIHPTNIEDDHEHNFVIEECWPTLDTDYDFLSVMHYGQCDFAECSACPSSLLCPGRPHGGRTIVMQPGFESFQDDIGQRSGLSDLDIQDMVDLYGAGSATYVDGTAPTMEQGTLSEPYTLVRLGALAARNGSTIWIHGGAYSDAGLYNRAAVWRAYSGEVVIR